VEEGKLGCFTKFRITNMELETCTLYFHLLTSKGGQGPSNTSVEKTVFTSHLGILKKFVFSTD